MAVVGAFAASAQEIQRGSGGPIKTELGYGIVINEDSSLQREWIVINDPNMPASLVALTGVNTYYLSGRSLGEYRYKADVTLEVKQPLSAIQVNFILFDVWGRHSKSVQMTEVKDFPVGKHSLQGEWRIFSENDVSEYYASIGYVSRVRTADARVIEMDVGPVVAEGQKFSDKFSASDVEPREERSE